MPAPFTVQALPPEQLLAVYPLVRETMPALTPGAWLRFARQLAGGKRAGQAGIVAAWRQGRNFPCGMFCYRVDNDLLHERVLVAEHFVAVDLLEPQAVLSALLAELEAMAARLQCKGVRSVVHGGNAEVRSGLSAAGHEPEASLLHKPIMPHGHRCRNLAAAAHHGGA
jgi:hypothetical protein